MTSPGDGPTPLEERGTTLGIKFSRGRTLTSSSILALEAADFLAEHPKRDAFHRAMFEAYFRDLSDIGKVDTIVGVAEHAGIDGGPLRASLEARDREESVQQSLVLAQQLGVTAVPTFVIDERYMIRGAQDYAVFKDVLQRLGKKPITGEA